MRMWPMRAFRWGTVTGLIMGAYAGILGGMTLQRHTDAPLYRIAPTDDMRVVALCRDGTQWRASLRAPLAHVCDGHYGVGFYTGAHQ